MQLLSLIIMQVYANCANTCSKYASVILHLPTSGPLYQYCCFNMDFLKSAVASAISKDPPFPYKFGDRLTVDQSIWALHNGTKRVCVLQDTMNVYS